MPTPEEVKKQIAEVVLEAGFEHGFIGEDEVLTVRSPDVEGGSGSSFVSIRCEQIEDESVLVFFYSVVLMDIPDEDETKIKAALIANDLNSRQLIGRWVFYPEMARIELEHEMIGDFLAPGDIISSITSIGFSGDQHDEALQEELGGRRPIDPPDLNPGDPA